MLLSFSKRWGGGVVAVLLAALPACKAKNTNLAPIADAGEDQVTYVHREVTASGSLADVYETIELDGSGSFDPDEGVLVRYFWAFDTLPIGSALTYEALEPNADISAQTSFVPDHEGTYGVTLQVFDGQLLSESDYVQIEVVRLNSVPNADAGPDRNGVTGTAINLDGSGSTDPDEDFLSYRWELELVPFGSLLSTADIVYASTPNPRITPDVAGVYALSLVVYDGSMESAPDFVTVTVEGNNQSPIVDPGESRILTPCHDNPITLDGSGSYDAEDDPFTFLWSVSEVPYGSRVTDAWLTTADAATTQVTLDLYGLYVFLLTLDDGRSSPSQATVAILFDNGSTEEPPTANAGESLSTRAQSVCTGDGCSPCVMEIDLDGTGSEDPNDDPLFYEWTVLNGSGTISDASSATPALVVERLVPPGPGVTISETVKVQLVVSDCVSESEPSTANFTFACEGV